eukprot:scaffold63208_cov27-Prasinocladus_malaysianus.AAC.1
MCEQRTQDSDYGTGTTKARRSKDRVEVGRLDPPWLDVGRWTLDIGPLSTGTITSTRTKLPPRFRGYGITDTAQDLLPDYRTYPYSNDSARVWAMGYSYSSDYGLNIVSRLRAASRSAVILSTSIRYESITVITGGHAPCLSIAAAL